MNIELEKLKKLEHALCDAIDILRDWQVEEVKSEEEKWIVYLAREENGICYLTSCSENYWESVQKHYNAKTKLFIGSESDAQHWYKTREKFNEVIRAWEDGKTIQYYYDLDEEWVDIEVIPHWNVNTKYRVKPEEKKYRPYENSAEMIVDFIDRFKVNCPSYCEPLIWVRLKVDKRKRLIVAYGDNFVEIGNKTKAVTLQHLFEQYEFLDGSPVGMEVKE